MSGRTLPILDLGPELKALGPALREAFDRVLASGQFIGGPEVAAFEAEAARYLGAAHAIGVNSGTDALVIALRALGIGPGDEVVTTPFTFFATAEAVSQVGATPVFADVDATTFNLDPAAVEAAISARTRAILPVHLFGHPAPMSRLAATAERHGVAVIEDCAQSFGARYAGSCASCGAACDPALRARFSGRMTGTMGAVGCFSFFPSKTLGALGDGGMIVTDDGEVAQLARKLRAHGGAHKYHNETLGYNSRLDALQAAFLRAKLPHVEAAAASRRRTAARYAQALGDLDGLVVPAIGPGHVVHQYTVRIPGRRDAVARALAAAGVQTMVYYPVPVHRLPVYAAASWGPFPVAEQLSREVLSLPVGGLTARDQDRVIGALRTALA